MFKIISVELNSGKIWKVVGNRLKNSKVTGTLTIGFDLKEYCIIIVLS